MRSVGLGFLMGLAPWREEITAMVKHAQKVLQANWRVRLGFSFPRLRPHLGNFKPEYPVNEIELAQMVFALRLFFPDAELVLSTREPARIRDGLLSLGITRISAGSSTQPGGDKTNKDQISQFDIDDKRTPSEISQLIRSAGMEPLWKDWDWAFNREEDFS
jgi:2-iminoacetate synthase